MKVSELINKNLSTTLEEKIFIKNSGKPTPNLIIVQVQKECKSRGTFTRKFDKRLYDRTAWLCGCDERNSLFCFVCLLFGGDDNWTREGENDLKHLTTKIKKHEHSFQHKNNFINFQLLGRSGIASTVSRSYEDSICNHNNTVFKNRHVLSKIIDILKLCGHCNISLRGSDEGVNSSNEDQDIFLELFEYTRNIDATLNSHLQDASVFKDLSKIIQNELLDCMLQVCRENILQEIEKSSFVAIMADDTTDISVHAQTALVIRYDFDGKVYERFWGFSDPDSHDAEGEGISKFILEQLEPILKKVPHKLIAHTYDGVAAMREHLGGVNVKIKEVYKNAHYMNCYTYQLKKIMKQAASCVSSARVFLANLDGISTFFEYSPVRMAALNGVCDKLKPRPSQTNWDFRSRVILTIFENRDEILQCFENIEDGIPKQYNLETTMQASGFAKCLHDDTFQFWLKFFSKLTVHVEILINQLKKIKTDALKIQEAIDNFENGIQNLRNTLPSIKEDPLHVPAKRPRSLQPENLNSSAREICDIIVTQIKDRFEFKNHLSGAKLFFSQNYQKYTENLPLQDIENFCEAFPMVNKDDLILELQVFYLRPEIYDNTEFNLNGCLKILEMIISFDLDTSSFREIAKVLKILITLPMITSEPERCFSTMKLIKAYLHNTMGEDRHSALAMLYIGKDLVKNISDFNEQVIEKFANKKNRMELIFK